MARRLVTIAALAALASCTTFHRDEPSPLLAPEPASSDGLAIPDSPPLREDFTTYLQVQKKVLDDYVTVGYVVRYDAVPESAEVSRLYREGTMFIEDHKFDRIGFITYLGRGYRYQGADSEEIGQGTLEQLLPEYFGSRDIRVSPLH